MPPPRRPVSSKNVKRPPPKPSAGLAARELAAIALAAILDRGRPLEEAFDAAASRVGPLEARDRAFARLIVMTVLRHKGELDAAIGAFLAKPLPADGGRIAPILLSAAAQLLLLETPPHAAISLAVDQCRAESKTQRFAGLANAVLRRVSVEGKEKLSGLDRVVANIPAWMLSRWRKAYGEALARDIALASLGEAALDLSVKDDAQGWAARLGGVALPTGSVRLPRPSRVEDLEGFADGTWWVQDAAAALPARLLGNVAGLRVADLCAAPGGKTAELAAAGAKVTAVDLSADRLTRLKENLARLALEAEVVEADVAAWSPADPFDAVLLDAPCSATGTIRRHPDILHLKRKDDTSDRTALQRRLLERAIALVRPGGLVVYCTCSLEPEEGVDLIAAFLASGTGVERVPIAAGEAGIEADWLTPEGDLRTLPCHLARPEPGLSGLDGFFATRLRRL